MSDRNLDNDRKSARHPHIRENPKINTTSVDTEHFTERKDNEKKSVGIIGIVEHYLTDRLVPSFTSQKNVNFKEHSDYDFQFNVELLLVRQNLEAAVRKKLSELDLPGSAIDAGVRAVISSAFTESASKSDLPLSLPEKKVINGQTFFCADGREPIPLYGHRDDKAMDAIAFYETYWKPFQSSGLLFRNSLKRFDESLITSIRKQCAKLGLDANNVLPPTKSEEVDLEIQRSGLSEDDILRLARVINYRRRAERTKDSEASLD